MNIVDNITLSPDNWQRTEPQEHQYTPDMLIDAYIKGKEEAIHLEKQEIYRQLEHNMDRAGKATALLLSRMKELGMVAEEVFLRIDSWDALVMMVVLPESDFLKPEMLTLYQYVTHIENSENKKNYHFHISFCGYDSPIDFDHIYSDGYTYKYNRI